MAQVWTDSERKVLKDDPLHDVKEEFQHHSPRLRHVDLPEGDRVGDKDLEMEDVVKSHVPEAFIDELQKDHAITQPATDFAKVEAEYMEDDPLHDVKQELEHHSPHLRHVESPHSPGYQSTASHGGGEVVKSDVPPAFEEELKNDHDIVKGREEEKSSPAGADVPSGEDQNVQTARDPVFVGLRRGARPRFRISANVGNRSRTAFIADPEQPGDIVKDEADKEAADPNDGKPAESSGRPQNEEAQSAAKFITSREFPARGTPHFRISAHHGMHPGGPLSRDLKSETTSTESPAVGGGDGAGVDLPAEMKPKGPGLLNSRGGRSSSAAPRRGGLARTGSGVPAGDQRGGGGGSLVRAGSGVPGAEQRPTGVGGLARTGSGVPGNSLARQGSGAFGGLARTGSGITSSKGGNNDLKDFSSFLDSADFGKEQPQPPASHEDEKSTLGKIGDRIGETWNKVNSYGSPSQDGEVRKDAEEGATGESFRSADAAASKNVLDVERSLN